MRNYLFDRPVSGLPNQPAPPVTPALRRKQIKQAQRRLKKSYRAKRKQLRKELRKVRRSPLPWLIAFAVLIALLCGAAAAIHFWADELFPNWDSSSDGRPGNGYVDGSMLDELLSDETTIQRVPPGGKATLSILPASGQPLTAAEVYRKALPSVVSVQAAKGMHGSSGSGIIMTSDGYVLTNYHVIEGMSTCMVYLLTDGTGYEALLVGYYEEMDLAVLKINTTGLTPAEFGSSRLLSEGDPVYALGNPLGYLYGSITDGIVSGVNRYITVGDYEMSLIQTSAALNSGNSGGALLNEYGQVVGITSAKISSTGGEVTVEGLGLALPISELRGPINSIIAKGEVITPRIGIWALTGTVNGVTGVLVDDVEEEGPAKAAGVQAGDLIIAVDDTPVTTVDELKDLFYDAGVGGTITLTLLRLGQTVQLSMTLSA